mgnify:FL=1
MARAEHSARAHPPDDLQMNIKKMSLPSTLLLLSGLVVSAVFAHGDVTPQTVDTAELEELTGEEVENPYRGNEKAIEIGASAYNQNCARCHGLGAVSGGIAPDLRKLPPDAATDEYFIEKVRNGVIRNGVTYMPPFADTFNDQAIWAIRAWLDTVYDEDA